MITPEDRDPIQPPEGTAPDPWEKFRPSRMRGMNGDYVYNRDAADAAHTESLATERSAHVAELEQLKAELAAVESVIRLYVCPAENSEDVDEPNRYVSMNEDGDVLVQSDTLADVVKQIIGMWDRCSARLAKAERRSDDGK